MGKKGSIDLVIPKNNGSLNFFDDSIRMVAENGGALNMSDFIDDLDIKNSGDDITSIYHKNVMARYFGMLILDKTEKKLKLTDLGTAFYLAKSNYERIDILFDALASVTFGKLNNATNTNSDVEAPLVFLKSILLMGSASTDEIGCILYLIEVEKKALTEAINIVKHSVIEKLKHKVQDNGGNKLFDLKFNVLFSDLLIVKKNSEKKYELTNYVIENYSEQIMSFMEVAMYDTISSGGVFYPSLTEYNPDISKEKWKDFVISSASEYPDAIELLKCIVKLQGECSYLSLAQELGKSVFSKCIGQCGLLGLKASKYFSIPVYENDKKKEFLSILMQGKTKETNGTYSHYVKLRQDLYEAVNDIFFAKSSSTALVELIEQVPDYLSVEELGKILAKMYADADAKTSSFHMLGVKYGKIIKENNYTAKEIILASGLSENYHAELSKGINIYESILSNEFGVKFFDKSKVSGALKVIPKFKPRQNKKFTLNNILYGAPGTGKTYATAKYALAIIEERDFSSYDYEPRNEIMNRYNKLVENGQIVFTTFHQNYGYEDFIQGIRPDTTKAEMVFKTVDGVFKVIADDALHNPDKSFVIVIDEINRANISKVFGELITLIENDKRWGEENAIVAKLPSGDHFVVPNNLYIIGTMNSADKSISLIDTALRRRFNFIEFIPNLNLVSDLNLRNVLKKLNDGLVKDLDSTDLLIGHSYFMNKSLEDICDIFNSNIIPLLYEYYYDNNKKVENQISKAIEDIGGIKIDKSSDFGRLKIVKKGNDNAQSV